ncbi:sensor histidine kinase [Halobacillus sp. A5]|uniref:sensor histidine kinase n=1 Tax=Halobacillus sp. A5 TaxID=2880263 RepID=UPI0020A68081|nr:sensor histidine kinase [Halobacillus sp. A5]MCP3027430.1 sensor histidine kinase [Halobacillus sp. A5]
MNTWKKQLTISVLMCVLLASAVLSMTLIAFPLQNWGDLWSTRVIDLPFVVFVLLLAVAIGLFIGGGQAWFSRRKMNYIEHQLEEISNGQELLYEYEQHKELSVIEEKMKKIEGKFSSQAEMAQKLASERAEEREKSLQEVVIQERNRLARELHDSVSQQLFAASMLMSAVNENRSLEQEEELKRQLAMVENMIHQSQLEMRALLLHLRPVALKGKSLSEGSEELLAELTQKVPMEVDWTVEPLSLDKGIEDQLFRILQEAVSNTLRHAKADSLQVMLIERDKHIILRVVDDGVGFNVEESKATSSYGLQNMKERAIEVGGTVKVISLEGEGTRLEVKVPVLTKGGEPS